MYSDEKINESSFAKIQIEEIPNNKRIFFMVKKREPLLPLFDFI